MAPRSLNPTESQVLLDGDCGLCSQLGAFLAQRVASEHLRLIARQSPEATELLQHFYPDQNAPDSVLVIHNNRVYHSSEAVLRIATFLPAPWPVFRHLRVIPRPIRDFVYRWIARNRRKFFPAPRQCPIR